MGNPVEKVKEGLWEPEGARTPQETTQSQLNWGHGASQRLDHMPGSLHGTDLGSIHICYSCVA